MREWQVGDKKDRFCTKLCGKGQYIEANSASSKKDFINFFTHALKSANESKVWVTLLRDTKKGDTKELEWLLQELTEIAKILASSILTMKGKR